MREHAENTSDDRPLAVMDVGTRAARLLIWRGCRAGDSTFSFGDYQNWGQQTGAASGLVTAADGRVHYHLPDFAETLRFLRQAARRCREEGIDRDRMVMVGTELFRRVDNAVALQALVRDETGLELLVLTPEEEAATSFCAVLHACRPFYQPDETLLIMEVGGGSMQLGVAPATAASAAPPRIACFPELGTVLLRRRFLGEEHEEHVAGSDLELLLRNGRDYLQERLSEKLDVLSAAASRLPTRAFALGNAVSELARCRGGNGRMHGVQIGLEELEAEPEWARPLSPAGRLESGYGLAGYAHVLRHFGLPAMTVCGAGLRYGVCFRLRQRQWTDLRLHQPVS